MGITCYMVRPNCALHLLASSQQWRVFHRWQLGHPSTSVLFPFGDDFGLDDDDLARAELVTPFVQSHVSATGTPNRALTVKTTVPTPCTPPFPILSSQVP